MFPWLNDVGHDLRYALRSLGRTPGFTAVAVLTLALGIGANTAIFSVVNTVLLRPLPYPDADRLVHFFRNERAAESPTGEPRRARVGLTVAGLTELRARTTALSHVGISTQSLMIMTGTEGATRLEGARFSPAIFHMRGMQPVIGRVFDTSEEQLGADGVVILSDTTWRQYFGGDPDILDRTLTLDDAWVRAHGRDRDADWIGSKTYAVVGVMPDGFDPTGQHQFWIPFALTSAEGDAPGGVLSARLADGVSPEAAASEVGPILDEIQGREASRGPVTGSGAPRYEVVRDEDALVTPVRPALLVLMVAVGFVLLIACVNVANLMLIRTAARQREMAIRVALGAGRGRMIRHLLTESVIVALLGGVCGTALALGGLGLLQTLATTLLRMDLGSERALPRLEAIGIDATVLAFTMAASVVTGLLCGVAPAIRHARAGSADALRESAATAYGGLTLSGRQRTRGLLVVAEVAMAMMLLIGGGLMIHSFAKLSRVDPGYDPSNVLTFQVASSADRASTSELQAFAEHLATRLRSLPEVDAAAYARQLPMVRLRDSFAFRRAAASAPSEPGHAPDARIVSRDYLEAMGMRVIAGRGLNEGDRTGQPRALMINQALARRDFPGENPIGALVSTGLDAVPWEIVGLVEDVRQFDLETAPTPQYFVDVRQWPAEKFPLFPGGPYYVVRAGAHAASVMATVRRVVREVDAQAGLYNVATMEEIVSNSTSGPRMYATLLGIFAGVAVALAVIGLYGVMAYAVAQRTREIGIRMALGARGADVMQLVLGQSLALTLLGIGLGLAGAVLLTRYLEGMLFGVTPLDPATFMAVSVMFAAVATFAAYVPARRATRVEPSIALRHE